MNMRFFEMLAALFVTMKLGNIGDFADWSWWQIISLHIFCIVIFCAIDLVIDGIIKFWRER